MKEFPPLLFLPLILLSAALTAAEPEDLTYITEDYAPSNYLEKGKLTGIAVELLKAIWGEMGVAEQPIQVLPWARGYARVQNEDNCVLFAMTRSASREALFRWVGPIYRGNYTLYSSSSAPVALSSLEEAKKYRIGVIREDFSEKDLLYRGFPPSSLVPVDTVEQLIRLLEIRRVDLLYLYADTLRVFAPMAGTRSGDYHSSLVVSANVMYYAFSRSTEDSLIARFQRALDRIDAERRAIVLRYGGTP